MPSASRSGHARSYLERQAAGERGWLLGARHGGDPLGSLRRLAGGIGHASYAASCSVTWYPSGSANVNVRPNGPSIGAAAIV